MSTSNAPYVTFFGKPYTWCGGLTLRSRYPGVGCRNGILHLHADTVAKYLFPEDTKRTYDNWMEPERTCCR